MRKKIREEKETRIFSAILILLTLIILGFLIYSNWKVGQKRQQLLQTIEELEQGIEAVQKRNEELIAGLSESEKKGYWEAKIREQGYQKPGETAVVIKKEGELENKETTSQSFWQKLWEEVKFWK